jgi:hypothetical protein
MEHRRGPALLGRYNFGVVTITDQQARVARARCLEAVRFANPQMMVPASFDLLEQQVGSSFDKIQAGLTEKFG